MQLYYLIVQVSIFHCKISFIGTTLNGFKCRGVFVVSVMNDNRGRWVRISWLPGCFLLSVFFVCVFFFWGGGGGLGEVIQVWFNYHELVSHSRPV